MLLLLSLFRKCISVWEMVLRDWITSAIFMSAIRNDWKMPMPKVMTPNMMSCCSICMWFLSFNHSKHVLYKFID